MSQNFIDKFAYQSQQMLTRVKTTPTRSPNIKFFDCLHPNSSSSHHLTMRINNLPSLVFRLIFSRLSLHDQLQVGRVCWLWKEYQRDITRKVRSLTLLVGIEDHDGVLHLPHYYSNPLHKNYRSPSDQIAQSPFTLHHCNELLNDQGDCPLFAAQRNFEILNVAYLKSSNVNLLVESLPNVNTLNIAINGIHCHVMEHVIRLLRKLKDKLITLKLWCNFSDGIPRVTEHLWFSEIYRDTPLLISLALVKLLESLNSLSSLDHLTLDFNHNFFSNYPKFKIPDYDFSILSRLSEFNFRSLDKITKQPMYEWLKQCDVNDTRLQRIGLDFEPELYEIIMALPLASKIIVIPRVQFWDLEIDGGKEEIRRYLNACPSLTSLKFGPIEDLVELLNMLAPFKQLIHLELDFEYYQHFESFDRFVRTPSHQIGQLSSVKLLTLKCEKHSDLNSPNWAWAFPNVQILQMQHNCFKPSHQSYLRCHDPFGYDDIWTNKFLDQLVSGLRDWLATFKQMPKLSRIYLNDYDRDYKGKYNLVKFNFTL